MSEDNSSQNSSDDERQVNPSRPGRLTIGVIGAGRVGAVLASALRSVGHTITAVSRASQETLDRVEVLLPGVPMLEIEEVARRCDLLLLTVPDDELPAVATWLVNQGAIRPGQIVLHTSGRHGIAVLEPVQAVGAIPLAVHPAMTFTGTSLDLARLEGAPFGVTAPGPFLPIGQALVVELGGEPVVLPEAARIAYHAALSHASNHLVTLISQSQSVLEHAGVEEGSRLLAPLTRAALDGALSQGGAALTGPVSRGDLGTVSAHLDAVAFDGDRLTSDSYRAMARATADLAERVGRLSSADAAAVARLLIDHPGHAASAPAADQAIVVLHTTEQLGKHRARMAGKVAVVMTMGALHEGHLSLVRAARTAADHVIVTIFVNPLQFGDPHDLELYPRTLEADVALLTSLGVAAPDVVFAPSADQMYPNGAAGLGARVLAGETSLGYEGGSRPGHFDGVLTVVGKLLHLTRADVAVFGQKDAQQLAVIRAMVRALDWPTWVLAAPIVRDVDGLALSSRNIRLSPQGREHALALSRAVGAAQRLAQAGASAEHVLRAARAELIDAPGVELDYADLVVPATFTPADPTANGEVWFIVAAVVEGTRLIDNAVLEIRAPSLVISPG